MIFPPLQLVCGGFAGSTAALLTTPFDVVKTRLQTQVCNLYAFFLASDSLLTFSDVQKLPSGFFMPKMSHPLIHDSHQLLFPFLK